MYFNNLYSFALQPLGLAVTSPVLGEGDTLTVLQVLPPHGAYTERTPSNVKRQV